MKGGQEFMFYTVENDQFLILIENHEGHKILCLIICELQDKRPSFLNDNNFLFGVGLYTILPYYDTTLGCFENI